MAYYNNDDQNVDINIPQLNEEYDQLVKSRNMMRNHLGTTDEDIDQLYKSAKTNILYHIKTTDPLADKIKGCKAIDSCQVDFKLRQDWGDTHCAARLGTYSIKGSVTNYLGGIVSRMAAIDILRDDLSKIDEWSILSSEACTMSKRIFRRSVETNVGYSGDIEMSIDVPPGTMEITTEPGQYGGTKWNCKIGVDGNWVPDVQSHGIEVVDIAGKNVLTLTATEIPEHELLDDDVQLFQAQVFYTKVPRDLPTWNMKSTDVEKMLHLEDKVIAIQKLPTGNIITTGKDKSWAIRTMKSRMKKKMMNMMDLI